MGGYLVVDASFTFRLLLPGPLQAACQGRMGEWRRDGKDLVAPSLWMYETVSALCKAAHFQHLTRDEARAALSLAQRLEVRLQLPDPELTDAACAWTHRLGRASAYDSFYLALAERLGCELWTADQRLANAAPETWLRLISEADSPPIR